MHINCLFCNSNTSKSCLHNVDSLDGFFCLEAARLRSNKVHAADGGQDASQHNLQLMHVMQAATSKGRDDEKGRKALISIS